MCFCESLLHCLVFLVAETDKLGTAWNPLWWGVGVLENESLESRRD